MHKTLTSLGKNIVTSSRIFQKGLSSTFMVLHLKCDIYSKLRGPKSFNRAIQHCNRVVSRFLDLECCNLLFKCYEYDLQTKFTFLSRFLVQKQLLAQDQEGSEHCSAVQCSVGKRMSYQASRNVFKTYSINDITQ